MITAYPAFHPNYDFRRLPISSYLQELPRQWIDFTFGVHNSPDAQCSYWQQGLLFGFPFDGAIRTFVNHHMAYSDFCALAPSGIIRGRDSGSEEIDIVSMNTIASQDTEERNGSSNELR